MNFVLAVTNYKRLPYLKQLIETWEQTKSDNKWKLIIADDGSPGDTYEYFSVLEKKDKDYDLKILQFKDVGVHNLTNAIFKEIDGSGFDFCFKADNDMYFKKKGWDLKYYNAAMETGFHHLVYNRNKHTESLLWDKEKNREKKLPQSPVCYGCFFTLTQDVLNKIGYFDIKNFGRALYGHRDYSIRCGLGGFNEPYKMWDIGGSSSFIEMQGKDGQDYIGSKNKGKYRKEIGTDHKQIVILNTLRGKRGIKVGVDGQ